MTAPDTSESRLVTIAADDLRAFSSRLFQAEGVSSAEADVVAASLVESNLCGHDSHGVVRVVEYLGFLNDGAVRSGVDLQIVSQTPSSLVCDGNLGFGQVQMQRLIDLLEPMARGQGLACGTMRRCGHVGRLGEWVEKVAAKGLAGLMAVNDNGVLKSVAPPGGKEPRISTNPIAIGVPTATAPLVLDISTSTVANGKVRVAQIAGRACPDGWLLDAEGRPTNDPSTRFADPPGSIVPMGGYKGFGLGMLMDILVGGLSGGFCPPAPPHERECNNVLMLVFAPARFGGLDHFVEQSQALCDYVRSATPINPNASIRLPNDRSRELAEKRRREGVPLDVGAWNQMLAAAERRQVAVPSL